MLLLAVPLVVTIAAPDDSKISASELRPLALMPRRPASLAEWLALPPQADAYLRDHFGLRLALIRAYALVTQRLLRYGNAWVLTGRHGWMFFRGDDMVLQSAGVLRRDDRVAYTADLLAAMQRALSAQGTRLLVAPPPNAATIYDQELPRWARNPGRPTEYDVLAGDLAARGVRFVDLRPALRAAKSTGQVYQKYDTHWTPRGAVASFNAIVRADGHARWDLNASEILGTPVANVKGDLARMLGIGGLLAEPVQYVMLSPGKQQKLSGGEYGTFVQNDSHSGPTIMIIGDSFTLWMMVQLVVQHAGRVVWLYHQQCGFDWKWIDTFHPDEVWWMPTERYVLCTPGTHPVGAPRQVAAAQ